MSKDLAELHRQRLEEWANFKKEKEKEGGEIPLEESEDDIVLEMSEDIDSANLAAGGMGGAAYVYVLRDPDDGEIRYVGMTENLRSRRSSHINFSENSLPMNRKLNDWRRKLHHEGKKPLFCVVESHENVKKAHERELLLMNSLRKQGKNLLNLVFD